MAIQDDEKKSSLQRLLSLDKSFDSFDERVQEAARILDLPLDDQDHVAQLPTAPHSLANTARLDFVLRWLVEKLDKDASARQSLQPWTLLRLVLQRMPSVALARSLSTSHILKTFTQALADLFPSTNTPPSSTTSHPKRSSKKRKRESAANDQSPDQHTLILAQVVASIQLLVSPSASSSSSSSSTQDAASENRMQALLRLDHPDLIRFLKHCLLGVLRLFSLQPPSTSLVASSLSLVQDLLALQPSASAGLSDVSFCTECLWPAALLLRSLSTTTTLDASALRDLQRASQIVDRLLATQLFLPARSAFFSDQTPVQKKRQTIKMPSLDERLAPLKSEIATLVKGDSADEQLALSHACIPLLLDLAVRSSPVATPKQKIVEAPWIQVLFNALSGTFADAPSSALANQTLNDMLDVLLRHNLTLESDKLVSILVNDCQLSSFAQDSQTQPDFPLIAKILHMNSAIFLDVHAPNTQALFQSLTIFGKAPAFGQINSKDADSWPNPRAMCQKIAIPLMQAYARSRNLEAFLEQWFVCLCNDVVQEESGWLLWTDHSLQHSLRQVLETFLTATQITQLLETRRKVLVEALSAKAHPKHIFASSVLLNAMIGALKTDATIDTLLPILEALVDTVGQAVSQVAASSQSRATYLLPLYSRLHSLWFPLWTTSHTKDEVHAKANALAHGPAMQHSLQSIQKVVVSPDNLFSWHVLEADSSFALIASICDMQRRLLGNENGSVQLFCQAAFSPTCKPKSPSYVSQHPAAFFTITAEYPSLLSCIASDQRLQVFTVLLDGLKEETNHKSVIDEFLGALFTAGDSAVKDDLFSVVYSKIEKANPETALDVLLTWPLKGFSRQQREKILDAATALLLSKKTTKYQQQALDLMTDLLETPNATAKIALEPSTIWALADLHYEQAELDALEAVCRRLLQHILDTKEQDRSSQYLQDLSKLVSKFLEKQKDLKLDSAPGKVRLLTVFFDLTETRLDDGTLSKLSHRTLSTIDSFTKRLWEYLSTSTENSSLDSQCDSIVTTVKALVDVPVSLISLGGSSTEKYMKRIAKQLTSMLTSSKESRDIPLPILIECFQQLSLTTLKDSPVDMSTIAESLLGKKLDARQHRLVLDAFTNGLRDASDDERIALVDQLIPDSQTQCTAERVTLVQCAVSSLRDARKAAAKSVEIDASFILVRLLSLLDCCTEYATHQQLVHCVISLLRNQPNLVTQYSAEMAIATVIALASPSSPMKSTEQAGPILEGLCSITQSLLQFHRSSLGGRFHLLVPLMQRLLACLFVAGGRDAGTANRFKHPPWLDSTSPQMNVKHAQKYSRLLENLCNPPQSNITGHRSKTANSAPDLVDETRKARMHVAQHAPHILHYFCTLILHGRLGEGMRDALTPGMWAVIEVAEIGADDSRGVKALSSSMGNAERAVLRGIWEDWRRFGGAWKG